MKRIQLINNNTTLQFTPNVENILYGCLHSENVFAPNCLKFEAKKMKRRKNTTNRIREMCTEHT